MKSLGLILICFFAHAAGAATSAYFGDWTLTSVRKLSDRDPSRASVDKWIGKTVSLAKNHVAYGDGFLWFQHECRSARFRIEPYRQTPSDPTTPADYGLDRFPRETLVVKCIWPDGKLTRTFAFEIVSPNRLAIFWDGYLMFLDRVR